jgi:hypothetical protein
MFLSLWSATLPARIDLGASGLALTEQSGLGPHLPGVRLQSVFTALELIYTLMPANIGRFIPGIQIGDMGVESRV